MSCRGYRMLLPPMPRGLSEDGPSGPYRSPEWIRWVMRAIILAKMVRRHRLTGSVCVCGGGACAGLSGDGGGGCVRDVCEWTYDEGVAGYRGEQPVLKWALSLW
jgi:hypothetical protein